MNRKITVCNYEKKVEGVIFLRWNWVDIAKGITILLVAGYHATLGLINDFVTMWFMPLFFVMSGYLLNVEKWTAPERCFVRNRFQRIMVPYFVTYAVYFVIWLAEGWLDILQLKPRLASDVLLGIFYGNGNIDWMLVTPMWFLPCLFAAEVIYMEVVLKRIQGEKKQAAAVLLLAAAGYGIGRSVTLPWGTDIAMVMQPFLFMGSLLRSRKVMPSGWKWAVPCIVLVFAAFFINSMIDVNVRRYQNLIVFFAGGMAGTLLTFQFAQYLDKISCTRKINELLILCGKWTLFLLIVHGIVEVRIAQFWLYLAGLPVTIDIRGVSAYALSYAVVTIPISILIPLILVKCFGNTRFMHLFCVPGKSENVCNKR